ncbi:MAG: hypothetical protein Tsb0010_11840 [Parvularculaceae bacterium]
MSKTDFPLRVKTMQGRLFGRPWRLAEAAPPPALSHIVSAIWEYQGPTDPDIHKIIPSGSAELMIDLGEGDGYRKAILRPDISPRKIRLQNLDADRSVLFRDAMVERGWVVGIHDTPLFLAPARGTDPLRCHIIAAKIFPWGAAEMFGLPAQALQNLVAPCDEELGWPMAEMRNRLAELRSTEARLSAFAEMIRIKISENAHAPRKEAVWAAREAARRGGDLRVAEICEALGVSRKHLGTLFKNTVGLTPKRFARLMRFRRAVSRLESRNRSGFSRLAIELGYSDQAHFIHEFTGFAGETPAEYAAALQAEKAE